MPVSANPKASGRDLASMTGFARVSGHEGGTQWAVEAKSVNGRSLEIRCRFAPGFDGLEGHARAEAAKVLKRGNVNIALAVTRVGSVAGFRLNRALLGEVLALAREIEGAGAAPPRLDALLAIRGIIEPDETLETDEARTGLEAKMALSLSEALDALARSRLVEGRHLAGILTGHLESIARSTEAAATTAALQPGAIKARLKDQLAVLLEGGPALSEDRLMQEVALIAAKADVREELDRLRAHIEQARALLAEGSAIGRRLDFLCQEFMREANTLCSKSADVELTRIGLELKASIEQFREQVQNVE